jgi:6-phosphogluconolactonase
MSRLWQVSAGFALVATWAGCGGGSPGDTHSPLSPVPAVVGFSPTRARAGDPDFDLTVTGSNFVSSSVVQFNGADKPTTFVDASHLKATIAAADIAVAGVDHLLVVNPAPSGSSNAVRFGVTPASGEFLYVSDFRSPKIFAYKIDEITGALTAAAGSPFASTTMATSTGALALDPLGEFFYAKNNETSSCPACDSVSEFKVDSEGALTAIANSPLLFGASRGTYLASDPTGNIIYSSVPGSIQSFSVDADSGALTKLAEGTGFGTSNSLAVHPSGKFVYAGSDGAVNVAEAGVWVGAIDPSTGRISVVPGSPFGKHSAGQIRIDPSGTNLVALCPITIGIPGSVKPHSTLFTQFLSFTIDPNSGTPTLVNQEDFFFPTIIKSVVIHPSGKFVYAADEGLSEVEVYANLNGILSQIVESPVSSGGVGPRFLAMDSKGKFLYVANVNLEQSGSISVFSIDATSGALTLVPGGPYTSAALPDAMVVGP